MEKKSFLKKPKKAKGFFITGTDTGVGKTIISVALIKSIGLLGQRAGGMKPIETGCLKEVDVYVPSDGMFIKTMAHMDENIKYITPCCFKNPLAPLPASEIEGVAVDFVKIHKAYSELSKKYDVLVVEGIGGLLVPINKDYFVADLAKEFELPIIVVARPGLGTLNHTLLTVNYALKDGLSVAGIILNYSRLPEHSLAEETNPQIISKISPVPIIGMFPYLRDFERSTIEYAAEKHLDMEIIKKFL